MSAQRRRLRSAASLLSAVLRISWSSPVKGIGRTRANRANPGDLGSNPTRPTRPSSPELARCRVRLLLCYRGPIIQPIEEQLERPMRLCPEQDLRAEQEQLALAHIGLGHGNGILEVLLSPRPAAAQWCFRIEPGNRAYTTRRGITAETERGAAVEHEVGPLVHAVRQRQARVDLRLQQRARHVKLVVRQRPVVFG